MSMASHLILVSPFPDCLIRTDPNLLVSVEAIPHSETELQNEIAKSELGSFR